MTSFSAVLLAGGRSTRMGQDKAMLPMPKFGGLLWQHQLQVLEDLRPETIFWSGRPRPGIPGPIRVISDEVENAGPLAGISACLDLLESDLLLVLAIDLPNITTAFLQKLLAQSSSPRGAVARHGEFFEPLAAVYPKKLNALAARHLGKKQYALQHFIREAIAIEALQVFPLTEMDAPLFRNLNAPSDLLDI